LAEDIDVVDAAVFGLPDERMGKESTPSSSLRPGARRDPEELLERLGRRLADYKRPRAIESSMCCHAKRTAKS